MVVQQKLLLSMTAWAHFQASMTLRSVDSTHMGSFKFHVLMAVTEL